MKRWWRSRLGTALGLVVMLGCQAQQGLSSPREPKLRGIPLSCYVKVGPAGIHPSVTSSLVELVNYQSAQWREMVLAYGDALEWERAIALIDNIEEPLTKNETVIDIAGKMAAAGNFEAAMQLVGKLDESDRASLPKFLARIARFYALAGNSAQAEQTFAAAVADADALNDFSEDVAKTDIAIEQATAKDTATAIALAQTIKDDIDKSRALAGIVGAIAVNGLFRDAVALVAQISDNYYKRAAVKEIADHASTLQLDMLLPVADTITEPVHQAAAKADIASAYIAAKRFDKALQIILTLKEEDDASLMAPLAGELAGAGAFDASVQVADRIKNQYWRELALVKVATGFAQTGDVQRAEQFAAGIASAQTRSEALKAIAFTRAAAGDYSAALELAKTIVPSASEATQYELKEYFIPLLNCALQPESSAPN
ncbi:MAG: hypothetical protein Fur0025_12790 [Oscillatoriaceae cyanobacterium]